MVDGSLIVAITLRVMRRRPPARNLLEALDAQRDAPRHAERDGDDVAQMLRCELRNASKPRRALSPD
jgi:hypothetical protein